MGCAVEKTDTGVEVDVHKFDTRENAVLYLNSRRYTYERHETWGINTGLTASGIDFYQGPTPGERASLRQKTDKLWSVAFWIQPKAFEPIAGGKL